jgi:hypothetical protein
MMMMIIDYFDDDKDYIDDDDNDYSHDDGG